MTYRPRQLRLLAVKNLTQSQQSEQPDDTAEGVLNGILSQQLREVADEAAAHGRDINDIARAVESADMAEMINEIAGAVRPGLALHQPRLMRQLRDGEQRIRQYLNQVWGPADQLFLAAAYSAYELGDRVSRSVQRDTKLHALLGLHARACRVAAEIRLLAMNGFASGAAARWRSTHELAVVAGVLSKSDESLATRYLAFAAVEQYRDAEAYQQSIPRLKYKPYTEKELTSLRQAHDRVIAEHGPSMRKDNGWAAPIFVTQANPERAARRSISFRDLEEAAGLDHLRPFYRLGSHHVHAGARASELNVIDHSPGGTVLTTGSTVYANIASTCHATLISLTQATASLVAYEVKLDSGWTIDHLVGMEVLQRLVTEAGDRYRVAAQGARDRGLTEP